MADTIKVHENWQGTGRRYVEYLCPGCGDTHYIPVSGDKRPQWAFDGSTERPTLHPSINTWWGPRDDPKRNVCHHFVRAGQIQFLNDCTHDLAGQTVQLKPVEAE